MLQFPKHERGPYRGQYMAPVGTLSRDFDGLQLSGCIQAETEALLPLFIGLWTATRGNPCDGCPVWRDKGPACKAFQLHHTAYRDAEFRRTARIAQATQPDGESVAQIAKRLGISKSEVRRRKVAGTL